MTEISAAPEQTSSSFAETLSTAIHDRGFTLARLHARLVERGNPVSMATLSYWRSGARRPEGIQSLAAVADLEEMLGFSEGGLLDRLGPSLRTGPLGSTAFPFDEDLIEPRVRETFLAMGAAYPDPTRELSIHAVTDVGADGQVLRRTTRLLVQATAGVVSAIPFVEVTPGLPSPSPHFDAVGGGRVSRRHTHDSGEVHGFLFELDTPISTPETAMIEWTVTYPHDFPAVDATGHGISFQARDILLWTRFHADAIPHWVEEIEETATETVVTPRAVRGASAVHAVRRSFGPGSLSMRWGFGERTDTAE